MPGNFKISQVSLTTHILCGLYTCRDRLDIAIVSVQCSNHVPAVATLIEIGADCNQGNKWTPLHVAVNKGHVEVGRALLAGACRRYDNQPNRSGSGEQWARRCSTIKGWVRFEKLKNSYFVPGLICVFCCRILWGSRLYWTLSARTWRRLVNAPGAKLSLKNKRGFNAQHQCTLEGNSTWVALLKCGTRAQRNWFGGQVADLKLSNRHCINFAVGSSHTVQIVDSYYCVELALTRAPFRPILHARVHNFHAFSWGAYVCSVRVHHECLQAGPHTSLWDILIRPIVCGLRLSNIRPFLTMKCEAICREWRLESASIGWFLCCVSNLLITVTTCLLYNFLFRNL